MTPETKAKIEADAKQYCDNAPNVTIYNYNTSRLAYIAGRTKDIELQQKKDNRIKELEEENSRLKSELELYREQEANPYWYWPQCDVEGCEGVSCWGGGVWKETGYWSVCNEHSQDYREGKPQPKMKQSSIDREASRDKETGYLPTQTTFK